MKFTDRRGWMTQDYLLLLLLVVVAVWLVILTVLSASGHAFSQGLILDPAFVPLLLAWAVFDTTLISMFSQRAYRRTVAELEVSRTEVEEAILAITGSLEAGLNPVYLALQD